jgi:hypothetical protein
VAEVAEHTAQKTVLLVVLVGVLVVIAEAAVLVAVDLEP